MTSRNRWYITFGQRNRTSSVHSVSSAGQPLGGRSSIRGIFVYLERRRGGGDRGKSRVIM